MGDQPNRTNGSIYWSSMRRDAAQTPVPGADLGRT